VNRRRARQRGQVIPIVALMLVIIAGFAALTIDAGLSYDQSRNDQDVSDSAALAASYTLWSGGTLSSAYTAAANVASADCNGPEAPCTVTVNFYGSTFTGSPACTWTSSSNTCGSVTASTVDFVGTNVSNTSTDAFAELGAANRTHTVQSQAVAEVSSTGGGGSSGNSTNPQTACEVCVFRDVTINGGDILESGGGSIDVGGYIFFNSSNDTVETTNGYGIDILGGQQEDGATAMFNGSSDVINASGNLSIDGGSGYSVFFNSSTNTIETSGKFNMSSTKSSPVDNNGTGNVFSPTTWSSAVAPAFTDPLATASVPSYTGAATSCGSVTAATWENTSGCLTVNGNAVTLASGDYSSLTIESAATVNPGVFGSMTIQANVTFNPGVYVLDGGTMLINSSGVKLSGTGVTFYMTCGSGTSPASCGTWSGSGSSYSCSSQSSGGEIEFNGSTTLDLSASSTYSNILFYFDRCNDNADAFFVNSSGVTADTGYPSGGVYADSGTIFLNAGTTAVPSPIIVNNIFYNTSSATLGTATGSIAIAPESSNPGDLVK